MPEYDPTHPPKLAAPDLTQDEVGRDVPGPDPAAWPTPKWMVPDAYDGPPPSREFETASGSVRRARPVPDVPDASARNEPSIAPPPGHTAQP